VSDDDVKTAVQSWTAETQMRAVQDYVSRGRPLEHSPEEALAGAWVGLVRAWAKGIVNLTLLLALSGV
jgi:hypothetical protein